MTCAVLEDIEANGVHQQDEAEHARLRPLSRISQRRAGISQSTRSLPPRVSTDGLPVFVHCARQQAHRSGWEAFLQLQVPIMAGVTANPAEPLDRLTGLVSHSQTVVAGAIVIRLLTCSGMQLASSGDRGSRVESSHFLNRRRHVAQVGFQRYLGRVVARHQPQMRRTTGEKGTLPCFWSSTAIVVVVVSHLVVPQDRPLAATFLSRKSFSGYGHTAPAFEIKLSSIKSEISVAC